MITTRRKALLGAAATAVVPALLIRPAFAQSDQHQGYALEMLRGGLLTKGMSEVALDQSQSQLVRQFAELEIAEVLALQDILRSAGHQLPTDLESDAQAILQEVQSASDFDAAYIEAQITAHRELLRAQAPLARESDIDLHVATAKLAEASIASHIAHLELLQRSLG